MSTNPPSEKKVEAVSSFVEPAKPAKTAKVTEEMVSFDRWFATTGRPVHHKLGMKVHISKAQIQGKRTVSAWNELFKKY